MTSEVTERANALVAERLPEAGALGVELADLIDDPEAFTTALTAGLKHLSDEEYASHQDVIAPGSGPTIGVRGPFQAAVSRALRAALAESSSSSALWLAQRLARSEYREVRLFGLPCLRRALPDDPERCWQLMRRLARGANDWISVDSLADLFAVGILREPFRWAELEQLVYSDRRMERRLVASTLARLPHQLPRRLRRERLEATRALELIGTLMGDADDQVRKALGWALREWSDIDSEAVGRMLADEADLAARTDDGNRAWVIRDGMAHLDPQYAEGLRNRLAGVRRRPNGPSTSRAHDVAAAFSTPAALADRAVAEQGERFARRGA